MRQIPLGLRLPDRAVFASFYPARNAEAVAHAQQVAQGAGQPHSPGCAARPAPARRTCCRRSVRRPANGCAPVTCRLSEVAALGVGVLEGFPQLGCLCLDDIDRVAGQLEWEHAIFALLRELEDSGGRLVLAAVAPPALLALGAAGPGLALHGRRGLPAARAR